ncbi:MAG: carboxypeptidase regulatory-like domain-containing protein [Kofleriaceae bacterium]|nr:carboxypeptidase regulatory-like domain-containing protein [Kofleriaceae bacterium]
MSIVARVGLAVVLLAAPAGCVQPWVCSDIAIPGVGVRVVDEAGRPVAATVTLADGDYVEILGPDDIFDDVYRGAYERPGTYEIEVIAEGYQPVSLGGVDVGDDGCHVETASVDVVMIATTPPPQP